MTASSKSTPPQHSALVRRAWVGATAVLLAATGFAAPAQALERDWHGVAPDGTVCNTDAATVASAPITFDGHRLGMIELRHSKICHTSWARLTNTMEHVPDEAHAGYAGYADIVRESDGDGFRCWSPPGSDTTCWTKMVTGFGTASHAYGNIDPYPSYGEGTAAARTKSYR